MPQHSVVWIGVPPSGLPVWRACSGLSGSAARSTAPAAAAATPGPPWRPMERAACPGGGGQGNEGSLNSIKVLPDCIADRVRKQRKMQHVLTAASGSPPGGGARLESPGQGGAGRGAARPPPLPPPLLSSSRVGHAIARDHLPQHKHVAIHGHGLVHLRAAPGVGGAVSPFDTPLTRPRPDPHTAVLRTQATPALAQTRGPAGGRPPRTWSLDTTSTLPTPMLKVRRISASAMRPVSCIHWNMAGTCRGREAAQQLPQRPAEAAAPSQGSSCGDPGGAPVAGCQPAVAGSATRAAGGGKGATRSAAARRRRAHLPGFGVDLHAQALGDDTRDVLAHAAASDVHHALQPHLQPPPAALGGSRAGTGQGWCTHKTSSSTHKPRAAPRKPTPHLLVQLQHAGHVDDGGGEQRQPRACVAAPGGGVVQGAAVDLQHLAH